MKNLVLVLTVAMVFGLAGTVFAQPFTPTMASDSYGIAQGGGNILAVPTPKDNNDGTPDINDAINLLLGTGYSRNSDVDALRYTNVDEQWKDLGSSNNAASYVLVGLTAGNSNTLKVYDVTAPATKISVLGPTSGFGFLGTGTLADPFQQYATSPFAPGTNFGWVLTSNASSWDSVAANNPSGLDHMLTYYLPALAGKTVYVTTPSGVKSYTFNDPYLIAWEDLALSNGKLGDEDFDDMMYIVDRVVPIPEPFSVMLLGSGLLGLAGLRRKLA